MKNNKTFISIFVCVLVLGGIVGAFSVIRAYAGLPLLIPTPDASPACQECTSDEALDIKPPTPNPQVPIEKIIDGTVVEVKGNEIVVSNTVRGLVTLHIVPETRIWKGKWDSKAPIEPGDFFYGYGEPNKTGTVYKMEQMEVNIVNLRGAVLSVNKTAEGTDIEFEEAHLGKLTVHVTAETLVTTEKGENPFSETPIDIKTGDGFQLIGLQLKDGTVLATRIF